jgi:hypothetical protein
MKNVLAAAAILVSLALASAALADGPQGHRDYRADTAVANPYQNTGSASAALQGYTTSGPRTPQTDPATTDTNRNQNTGSASAALEGYTTSGPSSTPVTVVATGGRSFDWGYAGIGAAAAIGVALVLVGGSLVVLRRRNRLAI